jgi:hypothetical protein
MDLCWKRQLVTETVIRFCFQHTSGIHTLAGNSGILIREFSSYGWQNKVQYYILVGSFYVFHLCTEEMDNT